MPLQSFSFFWRFYVYIEIFFFVGDFVRDLQNIYQLASKGFHQKNYHLVCRRNIWCAEEIFWNIWCVRCEEKIFELSWSSLAWLARARASGRAGRGRGLVWLVDTENCELPTCHSMIHKQNTPVITLLVRQSLSGLCSVQQGDFVV